MNLSNADSFIIIMMGTGMVVCFVLSAAFLLAPFILAGYALGKRGKKQ